MSDNPQLSKNAINVLEKRYLLKDEKGRTIETPKQMFLRVAKTISSVDKKYNQNPKSSEKEFYQLMSNLEFLPNSPTLMNAGTKIGQLAACFVIPVNDSIEGIFDAVKDMALIHQSGGGTGFSFSRLRHRGDIVKSTHGVASGPVSFMKIFDSATDVVKQGGKRRGANMGILSVNHPDITEFINAKKDGSFKNFNLSVAVDDKFMNALEKNREIQLINPRNKKIVKKIKAKYILDLIAKNAWESGDPGVIFIDEINRKNALKSLGKIESTNPCGEQPLLPYESCTLGSINLSKFVYAKRIDWIKLKKTVHSAVHFLDNVIDINKYPLEQTKEISLANRKIGLGVMGFADMLIELGIPYNSNEALKTAENIMGFITKEARIKSAELAKSRGNFPNFKKSELRKTYSHMRNATVTTIAPTGTLSLIADCSSSIEPLFALVYEKTVFEKEKLFEINKLFLDSAKLYGFFSKSLVKDVAKKGSLKNVKVPSQIRELFVTAHDMNYEWHVKMQASFQKYVDNAVSKTVNLNNNATVNDVKKIFLLAHKLKCKGITVYREGSKSGQIINIGKCKVCT